MTALRRVRVAPPRISVATCCPLHDTRPPPRVTPPRNRSNRPAQGDLISGVFADIEAKAQDVEEAQRNQKLMLKQEGRMGSADADAIMGRVRRMEQSPLEAAANVDGVKNYTTKGSPV